jgi:hypothetical protein
MNECDIDGNSNTMNPIVLGLEKNERCWMLARNCNWQDFLKYDAPYPLEEGVVDREIGWVIWTSDTNIGRAYLNLGGGTLLQNRKVCQQNLASSHEITMRNDSCVADIVPHIPLIKCTDSIRSSLRSNLRKKS